MTVIAEAKSISLYFRNGSSDKEYRAWIEAKDDGYVVNFAYGRRGAALTTGTKTSSPVEYAKAAVILEKLIAEKKGKGYTEGADGTPYQHSDRQVSGLLPQLLNVIDDREVSLIVDDPGWCMQEKFDGRRLLLRKTGDTIEGINKLGLVIGLPLTIQRAAVAIDGDFVIDGEVIADEMFAFDCLFVGSSDLRGASYRDRYAALAALLAGTDRHISCVDTWADPLDKAEQLSAFKADGAEGVVFKRWEAPFTVGRPNSGGPQLKLKFVATLSAVVTEINRKRSVGVSLIDGQGEWRAVGSVTIPANHTVPPIGAVVEVRYLYASPSLYQPVYLGERSDVEAHECVTAQLKFKATALREGES